MSYTNGIGNTQNPFAAETSASPAAPASSSASQVERTAPVSLTNSSAASSAFASPVDHTKLSAFGGALTAALSTSDVRMDKVTALQQAIANGTYNVSASDVADKIISSLLV